MTRWLIGWGCVGLALAGCATDDPDKIRLLESDQRALEVRLEGLKRAGERDLRLRDLRQDAVARVEALVDDELGPFLLLRRSWFQRMLDAVTPLKTSVGGFVWKLAKPKVSIENDGVRVALPFAVMSRRVKKHLGRPARGVLTGALRADRNSEGQFVFSFTPLDLNLDEKDFRAAPAIRRAVGVDAFEGLIPVFAAPLLPASAVECCGSRVHLTAEFDADRAVALPSGMLLPFSMTVGASDVPPEPDDVPPEADDVPEDE